MSLSLSSLLNPSPDSDSAPPPSRKESLPPIQYVQSPEQSYAASPQSAHFPRNPYTYPPATEHDAVQALAALSGGSAPPPVQSQWYAQSTPTASYDRRSNSYEQRPGSSGYNDQVQLPPPPTSVRNPSSPTLDQYHVMSRSPEQRRPSMISPAQAGFTLPPIQSIGQPQPEQVAPPLVAYQPPPALRASESDARALNAARSRGSDQRQQSPPPHLHINTSSTSAAIDQSSSPPTAIKQEAVVTPHNSSPTEPKTTEAQAPDSDTQNLKAIASLKNEHGLRTHSPLRESSVPVPSTEIAAAEPVISKKRPAPSKTKKGTATTTSKKAPPAKKRKVEPKRSVTPSSRTSKPLTFKTGSSKGTPANLSPAPSTRSQSEEADDEPYDDDDEMDDGDIDPDGDVYCICRKPDTGTFMIGCDGTCDDWFHGKCVGIEERDKNLIDKYVCPNCTKAGADKTTWKRMCRRSGCRQPARVGKTKGGKDGSKYCSEECGVMYFREMVARTRGREDTHKHRSSRRKSSLVNAERPSIDYDLGARGGTLAAGELKSLINSSTTADDFKKLGEGVLSPPATPDANSPTKMLPKEGDYTDSEAQALQEIHRQKEDSRRKHQLLKDRMKFVTMVKQAASRTAAEKELKPKEYCGYDSRLEWNDERFAAWRNSRVGKQAFELETLAVEKSGAAANATNDAELSEDEAEFEICDRKKCARHLEWTKLAVDDVRFEMSDNSDHMRALEKEEREIRERAVLRAKAGTLNGEGSVEVHGLGITMADAEPLAGGKMEGVIETVETETAPAVEVGVGEQGA